MKSRMAAILLSIAVGCVGPKFTSGSEQSIGDAGQGGNTSDDDTGPCGATNGGIQPEDSGDTNTGGNSDTTPVKGSADGCCGGAGAVPNTSSAGADASGGGVPDASSGGVDASGGNTPDAGSGGANAGQGDTPDAGSGSTDAGTGGAPDASSGGADASGGLGGAPPLSPEEVFINTFPELACQAMQCPDHGRASAVITCFHLRWNPQYSVNLDSICSLIGTECEPWIREDLRLAIPGATAFGVPPNWNPETETAEKLVMSCSGQP